jgi:hypothetical protein
MEQKVVTPNQDPRRYMYPEIISTCERNASAQRSVLAFGRDIQECTIGMLRELHVLQTFDPAQLCMEHAQLMFTRLQVYDVCVQLEFVTRSALNVVQPVFYPLRAQLWSICKHGKLTHVQTTSFQSLSSYVCDKLG